MQLSVYHTPGIVLRALLKIGGKNWLNESDHHSKRSWVSMLWSFLCPSTEWDAESIHAQSPLMEYAVNGISC